MPQLVKGGKYVFGWSRVGEDGTIVIPPEASYTEYCFNDVQQGLLVSASRTSGGFILGTRVVFQKTVFARLFEQHPALAEFHIPEGEPIRYKQRACCWITLHGNRFSVPAATLQQYGVTPGGRVLAVRGSFVGLAFIVRGPIVIEANKHPEIEVFG